MSTTNSIFRLLFYTPVFEILTPPLVSRRSSMYKTIYTHSQNLWLCKTEPGHAFILGFGWWFLGDEIKEVGEINNRKARN